MRSHIIAYISDVAEVDGIGAYYFGVSRDYGTVVILSALVLVKMISHAGIKDNIHTHFDECLNMAVHHLGGETYRIRRNGSLTLYVHCSV